MSWSVLPAAPAQAEALAAVHRAVFPPREAWGPDAIALQLALPGVFGLAEEQGGMLLARTAADEAEILTLAVLPALRRRGLGRALLLLAMAEARRRGATTMALEVAADNVAGQALYKQAGFMPVGRRRRYYADGADALVLRASL
jgi:[ribosomal protein S18]-alanine N-acetyltransferase